ncbi:Por secretion system C-terminal sorting domain-containing protein [Reichenbachiella faecimaris]|uniref:Por secretion system C-terminal sorting domain-containing protein n=1 Tax=Reichenbachiella faecimaris TaxID=692418 RepID=A0A1W2GLD0_REIFA|nr:family 16 glycosylhydrolase [Reichenbachiella faecimaris]SMD37371.1 Por secretion system C-terminal sorting domain-containing protein [Reichenbachiella faecimaris]
MNIIIRIIGLFLISNSVFAQEGYELVWSDEFDYSGLPDEKKWSYDIGDGCPNVCGWGNNELEYYTERRLENARVEDDHLIITAIKENFGTKSYSSARLITKEKGDWTYGRIEVRAKLPSGRGTWPAIWMLSTDWSYGGWPESGEIDIMEHVGYEPNKIYGTVHTKAYHHSIGTQKGGEITVEDCEDEFHIYAIDWSHSKIDFFVDNRKYFTFTKESGADKWPFDKRFHLLLNIAVGGNWGGVEGVDESVFPQEMKVDYVRVYQLINDAGKKLGTGQVLMSPNPANEGRFTINTIGSDIDKLEVYNMSGRQLPYIKSMHAEGIDIKLSDTHQQMVMVLVENKNGTRTSSKMLID